MGVALVGAKEVVCAAKYVPTFRFACLGPNDGVLFSGHEVGNEFHFTIIADAVLRAGSRGRRSCAEAVGNPLLNIG